VEEVDNAGLLMKMDVQKRDETLPARRYAIIGLLSKSSVVEVSIL
jgi:hypothetical protein